MEVSGELHALVALRSG